MDIEAQGSARGHAAARPHPLILAAAGSLLVFGAAGTAAVLGWLPGSPSRADEPVAVAAAPAPAAAPAAVPVPPQPMAAKPAAARPAPKPAPQVEPPRAPVAVARAEPQAMEPPPVPVRVAEPVRTVCTDCGTVAAVNEVDLPSNRDPGLGAVLGGVAGGAAGSQIGGGKGRYVGAVLGAVGGAVAGHQIEKRVRTEKAYEVVIRLDDGTTRTITQPQPPAWRAGDRVRVIGNGIEQAT